MVLFWPTLIFLHRVYAVAAVETVKVGEPATFSCAIGKEELHRIEVHWYQQRPGESLRNIVTLWQLTSPKYGPGFSESRWQVHVEKNFVNLTILMTLEEDEGMYHCAVVEWIKNEWSGTYLIVKGNTERASDYSVVQRPKDPAGPEERVTLKCSVHFDSEKETMCSGNLSVFWFRVGSQLSHSNIVYSEGSRPDDCERSETRRSCTYDFYKDFSSSEDETYYCAVATCGQMLFGNWTKVDFQGNNMQQIDPVIILLCAAVLVVSLIVIGVLIYVILKENPDQHKDVLQKHCGGQKEEDMCFYSAVVYSVMKTDSGSNRRVKASERNRIYTAVKTFGLDS